MSQSFGLQIAPFCIMTYYCDVDKKCLLSYLSFVFNISNVVYQLVT